MLRPLAVSLALLAACNRNRASAGPGCDDSIKLPPGFCARIFSDSAGPGRHLVVRKNGDVIVGVLDQRREAGGSCCSATATTTATRMSAQRFGESGVHGVALSGDSVLYASTATAVLRYRFADSLLPKNASTPSSPACRSDRFRRTASRSIVAETSSSTSARCPTDARPRRSPGAAGRDPCPELDASGGIWSFRTDRLRSTCSTERASPPDCTMPSRSRQSGRHDDLRRLARPRRAPRSLARPVQRRGERDGSPPRR